MNKRDTTPLVIIGAGAAGLMAATYAGEHGIPTLLLERKHRAGSKIMMCGNGRCNLSSDISTVKMLQDFGPPLDTFLQPALNTFGPAELQQWFKAHNLPLMRTKDGKIFPASEKAADVVRCFSDSLRQLKIPVCFNAPVVSIERDTTCGFVVTTATFSVKATRVLICTGGVSYPKTGSVGDGQKFASSLGHKVLPYRPGLVGIEYSSPWHKANLGREFRDARVKVFDGAKLLGTTGGLLECEHWGLGGGAISNATRLLARHQAQKPVLEICFARNAEIIRIAKPKTRPLKEAMVTVGGVDLHEIDSHTMQSRKIPGLYFAGEVLDIDGPTGGYNLTAAFATARLAIKAVAAEAGFERETKGKPHRKGHKKYLNNRKSTVGGKFRKRPPRR